MQYRKLGHAGAKVSVISLGGWINFENKLPEKEAQNIIATAIDGGLNFFDVADVYGAGKAETWMGGMLKAYPRHTLVISTKVFGKMSEDINDQGLSRKHIMESIDKSLARLGTDYVDIYFCHRPDRDTPILETAWAMHDLITQGKVLYWGTSEWEPEQLDEAARVCDAYRLHPPRAEQPQYSMLYRERVEKRILPIIRSHGIGLTVFSPLGLGLLTGKYDDGIPEDSRYSREPWAKERNFTEANVEKVKRLKPIADGLGITRTQLALAWALREYGISSVITSATTAAQIKESLGAAVVTLNEEVLAEIDDILTD